MSKELAKYGIKTVTNLATAEELPVAAQPAIKTGASLFSHSPAARIPLQTRRGQVDSRRKSAIGKLFDPTAFL
jgi:hypothetical protein